MLAHVRKFSSLTRVLQAPSVSTSVLSAANPLNGAPEQNKIDIQKATLQLLEATVANEKMKPVNEASQRFQKIHQEGDIYHPEDLNDTRYRESLRLRRGKPKTPTEDPFEVLGLDPLHEYKNFRLLTEFVTDMGKIKPREQTGVSAKNQRKLAKAIKRARAMGLMSSTSNNVDHRGV